MTRRELALAIVTRAFAGRVDKAGAPYIEHLKAVAAGVEHLGEAYYIAGLLHDLLEDCPAYTALYVRALFGVEVAEAVVLLTRPNGMPYQAFIERLAGNAIARAVKLADLAHNMDLSRFGANPQGHGSLMPRYLKAREYLLGVGNG